MKHSVAFQAAVLVVSMLSLVVGDSFDISWNSIDGGGAMRCRGGAFALSGTIGQPDAGTMGGGNFKLTGGFWFETPPGDCNVDGLVTLSDHSDFVQCLGGPNSETESDCACFDLDGSAAVDLADFSRNQRNLAGP